MKLLFPVDVRTAVAEGVRPNRKLSEKWSQKNKTGILLNPGAHSMNHSPPTADEDGRGLLRIVGSSSGGVRFSKLPVAPACNDWKMRSAGEALPFGSLLPYFITPMAVVMLLRRTRKAQWSGTGRGTFQTLEPGNEDGEKLLLLRADPGARTVFGLSFAAAFLLVFSANALAMRPAFKMWGLYAVLVHGSIKGVFFGLVAGVGVLYLRTRRAVSKAGAKK